MHRVLRRPMFRIGGVAEGITSGLDNPQLTASRPSYKRGRVVNPGGYAGDDTVGSALEHMDDPRIQKFIRGERRPQWPQFLTSMGLNLLSTPPQGNIFQTAATAAKGPYEQMAAMRSSRGAQEDKLSAALFGDLLNIETRKYEAQKKVEAEAAGKTDKEFDIGQAAKIAKLRDDMYEKRLELETEKSQIEAIPENERTPEQIDRLERIIGSLLPSTEANIADLDDVQSFLEKLESMSPGMQDKFDDLVDGYIDEGMTLAEAYIQAKKDFEEMLSAKAEGGRVGYQNAGAVLPNAMPAAMQTQAPRPTDQGQDSTVQDLSFEELRARLPQEITSDIVKLLSESKQALVDFANIRTQQDVNAFNQKYDVNLVVPQEV